MSAPCSMRLLALFLLSQPCASNQCESVLCTEGQKQALLEDAAFDQGIQLVQTRAKKIKQKVEPGSDVPWIDQNFKPSLEDWKKVQSGLFLLRGHAETSIDHKAASAEELHSMLVTLKGLYNNSNQSVTELNAKEQESKEWFANEKTKHEQRLAQIDARDKKDVLSHDLYITENRSENLMLDYWGGVRDRQHKKYVSFLKVKNGMMERVKAMIDVYEAVLAGNAADITFEESGAFVGSRTSQLPDHHQPKAIIDFCDAALTHVSDVLGASSEM